jgi:hypothetical protein
MEDILLAVQAQESTDFTKPPPQEVTWLTSCKNRF